MQKALAQAGVCSRRACEALIATGRLSVNGQPATLGQKIVPGDHIALDGRPIALERPELAYYAVNKPVGVVSTVSDERGRPTVRGLVASPRRLYPVGRLDAESEGLVLLTNDGELAHRLTHPRFGVPKVYEVRVTGQVPEAEVRRLRLGVQLDDGLARPRSVQMLAREREVTLLRLVMGEGRKREIRRLFQALGREVIRLRRIAIGPLELGELTPGASRALTRKEVQALRRAAGLEG